MYYNLITLALNMKKLEDEHHTHVHPIRAFKEFKR